jgi:DNA-binding transcriptional regulator YiaG
VITICRALCKKPGKLSGAEFRYIRAALLLSQKALGQLFGYTEQAVAKWEKHGKVPKVVDAALRMIFIERHDGNKKVTAAVDMLNAIDRISNAKIIITEEKSRWISVIEV